MTPKPPDSSDGSALPPRHRPNMGNLAKDTTELDLWAFDDDEKSGPTPVPPVPRLMESEVPASKSGKGKSSQNDEDVEVAPAQQLPVAPPPKPSIRVNVSKSRMKESSRPDRAKADADFDDLDSWDEPEVEPAKPSPEPPAKLETPETAEEKDPVPAPAAAPVKNKEPEEVTESETSPSPDPVDQSAKPAGEPAPQRVTTGETAAPVSLRPAVALSKLESMGLLALLAILLIGGGIIYFSTINRLPRGAELAAANDFPIEGQHLTINSAETYWRAPVTEGADADTFRRDTLLLPVASLDIGKGSGAVRVFFRDGKGELVGDAVTRSVSGSGKLHIAATAGFEDAGMYAGYRTGLGKVWTIEVHEASSAGSGASGFHKLFEMSIAPDRR